MAADNNKVLPKSGPGADLRAYMNKQIILTVNETQKINGTLCGYDVFMNLTLDNAVEIRREGQTRKLGRIMIRGCSINCWESLNK